MSTFHSKTGKLAPQSILQKRYLILRLAGRGGMSAIYLALDMKMSQRRVAIKEMSLENLDDGEREEAVARFQQEAQLLADLHHPALPQIYDIFVTDERTYLVMDYINGKTLLQLLQEAGRPLPIENVISYSEQLCDVLIYLHSQNPPIIFRDLKPTNVMVTEEGHVYLIDFGIARFFKEGQSKDTVILGSPGYAPPEQHGSGQTSPRSDLYALGATLHCCLTNRDPYNAEELFTFAPASRFNSQVPPELDRLVLRLVALDEEQRPTSALEVKHALVQIHQKMRGLVNNPRTPVIPAPATPLPPTPPHTYQPTQFGAPISPSDPQERLVLRSNPNQIPGYHPSQGYPAYGQRAAATQGTRVWTPGFVLIFLLMLIITVGGSVLAFNISNPYSNGAGLDHTTEAALAVLVLLLSFTLIAMTRGFMAVLILLLNVIAILPVLSMFLLQTLYDIQPTETVKNSTLSQLLTALGATGINTLITYGLLALGVASLLWLFRIAFNWGDRIWLFLFFGLVIAAAYLQVSYPDSSPPGDDSALYKHLLLLGALIIFIQGLLMAGQMERRRKRSDR